MAWKPGAGERASEPVSVSCPETGDTFAGWSLFDLDREGLEAARVYAGGILPAAIAVAARAKMTATGLRLAELAALVGVSYNHMRNVMRADLKQAEGKPNCFGLSGEPAGRFREWLLEPPPTPKVVSFEDHPKRHRERADNVRPEDFDMYDAPAKVVEPKVQRSRLRLVPFDQITLPTDRRYIIKGVLPREGLVIIWGAPKSCKSFHTFDMMMYVALGWDYRGYRVMQGPVVYCACEGGHGFRARKVAWEQEHLSNYFGPVPFYLVAKRLDLKSEHGALGQEIENALGETAPLAIVMDTINRSFSGSESSDWDMSEYIAACDALRERFSCAVVLVHHCGIDPKRPRGHTSLAGAADGQIKVARDSMDAPEFRAEVEWLKDGPEGAVFYSRLRTVEVGTDDDGDAITSCVVEPCEAPPAGQAKGKAKKLPGPQETLLVILKEAGTAGLTKEEWNRAARDEAGMKNHQVIYKARTALKGKKLIHTCNDRWYVSIPSETSSP